jgi:catechol 2,3-dioxygenase-like lactoylglutathione lyase family enzyme
MCQVNVNTSDMARALAFYSDAAGIPIHRRLTGRANTGATIDIPTPHTNDLAFLAEGRGHCPIEIINWRTNGQPPPVATGVSTIGYAALELISPEVQQVATRLRALGFDADVRTGEDGDVTRIVTRDPDGTWIEIVPGDRVGIGSVVLNCSNLARSSSFYTQHMDFRSGQALLLNNEGTFWREEELTLKHASAITPSLRLREWIQPAATGTPPARLDALGVARVGYITDDVFAQYEKLAAVAQGCFDGPGTTNIGNLHVEYGFVTDPDGCFVELAAHRRKLAGDAAAAALGPGSIP